MRGEKDLALVFLVFSLFVFILPISLPRQVHLIYRRALANKFQDTNIPEQIHLSLGSQSNNIIVVWSTAENEKGFVNYGTSVDKVSNSISSTVELKQNSEQAAKFIHRAELKDLEPGGHYVYQVVSENSGLKSDVFSFDVPHQDPQKPDVFLVTADLGLRTKSLQFLVHEVLNYKYETVFHIGDIAYNLDLEGGNTGDEFMRRIQKFTSRLPYMTTPGDHEREIVHGGDTFYHYRHRFSMPNAPWPMTEESLWYSINIGHAHFISINTESLNQDSALGMKQLDWLRQDLLEANMHREFQPWIVVMGHKPMYCTKSVMEQICDKDFSALRDTLEDLFYEFGVDIYFSGHKHCYERSWPLYQGKVFQNDYINPMAPVYVIIGSMGYEYLIDKQRSDPHWLAFASSDGTKELFGRLIIHNSTSLFWSVHAAFTNEEVDKLWIIQKSHGSFGSPGPDLSVSSSTPIIVYSPAMLRSLRPPSPVPQTLSPTLKEEPGKLKPRKRGKKGGVRARFRRRAFRIRPPLPAIVTGNPTLNRPKRITNVVNKQRNKSPDNVVLITRDFNQCTLSSSLPTFHQYITCPTRNNKTMDLCYGNVEEGYKSTALPP
ncbi:purple acid phosphatase [Elysia marginata]|uniref:Purple acid phosphatase n=1 Tax=Elysia marginata TaxID=1093978 RepID=A0AAV4JRH5_9GAST|nr:purple acid phosphatase [Elysia marginata]